jgi:hypothetical protein
MTVSMPTPTTGSAPWLRAKPQAAVGVFRCAEFQAVRTALPVIRHNEPFGIVVSGRAGQAIRMVEADGTVDRMIGAAGQYKQPDNGVDAPLQRPCVAQRKCWPETALVLVHSKLFRRLMLDARTFVKRPYPFTAPAVMPLMKYR